MYKELKEAIIKWLLDNENAWQRVNACREYFRAYISDGDGHYLIGGATVSEFIREADELLYARR